VAAFGFPDPKYKMAPDFPTKGSGLMAERGLVNQIPGNQSFLNGRMLTPACYGVPLGITWRKSLWST
jgi:hypothetical protein